VSPDTTGEPAQRLAALAAGRRAHHVVLQEQASLSWLLGARSHVPQTLDTACFDAVLEVGADGDAVEVVVVTNEIEAPRLREVELVEAQQRLAAAGTALRLVTLPWWRPRAEAMPGGPGVLGDRPGGDRDPLGPEFARLRRVLDERQAGLLADVCADAQRAVADVARRIGPTTTEQQAAGQVSAALLDRGAEPVALFVAGHDRMARHRHPLATAREVGSRAVLVCCARRDGLVASVTRLVCFAPVPKSEFARYDALLQVEAAFLDATSPATRLGTAFEAGAASYARHGFASDEWHRHHQGGFSGWAPREYPAHPGSDDVIEPGSVVAWNPSGDGWKVEDTWIVGPDGPRVAAVDCDWPAVTVGGRTRPGVLQR